MVTGIEATGVVLALLPLLLNQLDNYVQGLETLRSFTAKRYRRELESYHTNLGAQQAIFLNTLGHALKDTDEATISTWIRNPKADSWVGRAIHETFQTRLGTSFEPFMRTTWELSKLLEDLSIKLGLINGGTLSLNAQPESFIKKEAKRFRNILSKSIYADLLSQINTANTILKTLVDQSLQRPAGDLAKWRLHHLISVHRSRRKSAQSLYNAVLSRDCWNCSCKDQHSVELALDPSLHDLLEKPHKTLEKCSHTFPPLTSNHTFRLEFTLKGCATAVDVGYCGHQVEAESIEISHPVSTCYTCSRQSQSDTDDQKAKQICKLNISELQAPEPLVSEGGDPVSVIPDLCSTILTVKSDEIHRELLGCIADKRYHHHMYHLWSIAHDLKLPLASLEELIATSSTFPQHQLQERFIFSRRHRLILAVNLASCVLHYHGNWLRKYWRASDIMFMKEVFGPSEPPYVVWDVAGEPSMDKNQASSPLIRSEVLFPLGLVLVELSLCRNLESLRTQEDEDSLEAVANLKTAARYLPAVEMESGLRYGQVVKRCLFGSDTVATISEDESMHEIVFEYVIAPLVQNLRDFDGQSSVYR